MESRWRYVIGAIFIPCLIGGIALLDSHSNWAYVLFTLGGVSIIWAIWPLVFKIRAPERLDLPIESNARLSEDERRKVTELMESVNAINDEMDRFMDEALYGGGDRVKHYRRLLRGTSFQKLWNKCSYQRAQVSVISPELSELVWSLLKFTESHHGYYLREWRVNQLSQLSRKTDEHLSAILAFRKRIQKVLEQLLNRGM